MRGKEEAITSAKVRGREEQQNSEEEEDRGVRGRTDKQRERELLKTVDY